MMPLVNLRKPTDVPMVLDVLEESGFLGEMAKRRILQAYREDINRAIADGRGEVLDVIAELSPGLRAGNLPEGL